MPTFTELYYRSPANMGNPNLKPEKSWTFDAGLNCNANGMDLKGTVFLRKTEDLIDWTRNNAMGIWQVQNLGEFDMYGLESSLKLDFDKFIKELPLKTVTVKYAYLEALDKKGITSKYVLEYLKHNLNFNFYFELPFGFKEELDFSFRKRIGSKEYFLLNSVLSKDIDLKHAVLNVFLRLDNIFDTDYEEMGDIKMPGRAIFAGASIKF